MYTRMLYKVQTSVMFSWEKGKVAVHSWLCLHNCQEEEGNERAKEESQCLKCDIRVHILLCEKRSQQLSCVFQVFTYFVQLIWVYLIHWALHSVIDFERDFVWDYSFSASFHISSVISMPFHEGQGLCYQVHCSWLYKIL